MYVVRVLINYLILMIMHHNNLQTVQYFDLIATQLVYGEKRSGSNRFHNLF